MSKLSFGELMSSVYPAIAGPEGKEAYLEYREKIKEVDAQGELRVDLVRELVAPNTIAATELEPTIRSVLDMSLQVGTRPIGVRGKVFEPGASMLLVQSNGTVLGVHEQPNKHPKLAAYGNGLLWAAMKVGDESYAIAATDQGTAGFGAWGYDAVCEVQSGKARNEIPFKDRPHLGGASIDLRHRRGHGNQGPIIYAGVSGVLLTGEALMNLTLQDKQLDLMYLHARAERADDDFEGNIFAGSLDSTVGSMVLGRLYGIERPDYIDMRHTITQFGQGVNVH